MRHHFSPEQLGGLFALLAFAGCLTVAIVRYWRAVRLQFSETLHYAVELIIAGLFAFVTLWELDTTASYVDPMDLVPAVLVIASVFFVVQAIRARSLYYFAVFASTVPIFGTMFAAVEHDRYRVILAAGRSPLAINSEHLWRSVTYQFGIAGCIGVFVLSLLGAKILLDLTAAQIDAILAEHRHKQTAREGAIGAAAVADHIARNRAYQPRTTTPEDAH